MFRDDLPSPRYRALPIPARGGRSFALELRHLEKHIIAFPSAPPRAKSRSQVCLARHDVASGCATATERSCVARSPGFTTGLGWSNSEDEDAPSLFVRRSSAVEHYHCIHAYTRTRCVFRAAACDLHHASRAGAPHAPASLSLSPLERAMSADALYTRPAFGASCLPPSLQSSRPHRPIASSQRWGWKRRLLFSRSLRLSRKRFPSWALSWRVRSKR
jgi:hypothetical protein